MAYKAVMNYLESIQKEMISCIHRQDVYKRQYEHSPEALRDAGIAYAIDQIVDLVLNGVDGIHLYTMNNPYVAKRISEAVESIIRS